MRKGCSPTYNENTIDIALDYINDGYKDLDQVIPSGAGLARHIGVHRRTLYKWAEDNEGFKEVLETMNDEQEVRCLNHGLTGKFTPVISKLILAKHGYHDKMDSDVTSKGESVTRIEVVGIGNSTD